MQPLTLFPPCRQPELLTESLREVCDHRTSSLHDCLRVSGSILYALHTALRAGFVERGLEAKLPQMASQRMHQIAS